jgi:ADP-ribosyl-[dinitrogen reductase] hydrolase
MTPHANSQRALGCIVGSAVGDALGAPFEHILPGQSNQQLDKIGGRIEDFHPYWRYPAGSWTDDTGMALATCRAFIEMASTEKTLEKCFKEAFEAWSTSQECRRPGKTVLYAAKFGESDVNSWANGALMRISPVAIYSYLMELNIHETSELAYKIARLTHGHPLATFPAVSCAQAISSILHGEEQVPEFSSSGLKCGETVLNDPPAKMAFYTSDYEPKYKGPIKDLPATTGLWMWRNIIEICLGLKPDKGNILYWSELPEFESGILYTINNSFDGDTAGAVAGAILGTYWGESGIPNRWKEQVEKADLIRELADKLIERSN